MPEREMLEMAARAAGMMDGGRPLSTSLDGTLWAGTGMAVRPWRPHDDDGQAFRLAVALRIDVQHDQQEECVFAGEYAGQCFEDWNGAPLAATRLAIVKAAAAIGEKTRDDTALRNLNAASEAMGEEL